MNATPDARSGAIKGKKGPDTRSRPEKLAPLFSLLALALSAIATFEARRLATSDFQAGEQVKANAAQLAATMISLVHKGSLASFMPDATSALDMSAEREAISSFLTSPSAMAYHMFASKRSASAGQGQPEEWRVFNYNLHRILGSDDPRETVREAHAILSLLETLDESQIDSMTAFMDNLVEVASSLDEITKNLIIVDVTSGMVASTNMSMVADTIVGPVGDSLSLRATPPIVIQFTVNATGNYSVEAVSDDGLDPVLSLFHQAADGDSPDLVDYSDDYEGGLNSRIDATLQGNADYLVEIREYNDNAGEIQLEIRRTGDTSSPSGANAR